MQMTLERYIQILNTKLNLKNAAKKMGFVSINGTLFRKYEEDDETWNIKFDDECIDIWFSRNPRRRTSQYYNLIRNEIDKGYYTEESYIEWTIKNIKYNK